MADAVFSLPEPLVTLVLSLTATSFCSFYDGNATRSDMLVKLKYPGLGVCLDYYYSGNGNLPRPINVNYTE